MAETKTPRTVTMDDGRVVDFPGKTRLIKTTAKTPEGALQVRLDFESGETRLFTLRADMVADFALHGASQKLGDEISGIEDIEDAVEAVDQLIQRLDAGQWNTARQPGSGMAGASILAKALVKVTGQSVQTVRDYLAKQDNKVKSALRLEPSVAAAIKVLEAEKAARAAAKGKPVETVDVAAKLAELGLGA